MSLKHNPFDNTYKGSFVRRRKVFEDPIVAETPLLATPTAPIGAVALKNSDDSSPSPIVETESASTFSEDVRTSKEVSLKLDARFAEAVAPSVSTPLAINEKSELGDASAAQLSASEAVSIELCDPLSAPTDPTKILQSQPVNTPTPLLDAHSFDLTTPTEVEPLARASVTEGLISSSQKPGTKWGQTEDKVETKPRTQPGTKWGQTEDKTGTSNSHTTLTEDKVETKPRTQPGTKWGQTEDKVETNLSVHSLVGLQLRLLFFFYSSCQRNRSHLTEKLPAASIAVATNSTILSVKKSIQRLELSHFVRRHAFKNGRAGWTIFELPDLIFRELLQIETEDKVRTNWGQSKDKLETKLETEPGTARSSSSSFLDLTKLKTTTSEPEVFQNTDASLSPEWARVDISCVSGIGFTKHQLVQLIRDGHLTPVEVGDSLAHFAFAYERGDLKKIAKPLGYLMSILRKPSTVPCPEGYETPLEASRRLNREAKRRSEERRQEEEREFQDLEFAAWRRELTAEKVDSIVPEVVRNLPKGREMALKSHFSETVWPKKRVELFGPLESEGA